MDAIKRAPFQYNNHVLGTRIPIKPLPRLIPSPKPPPTYPPPPCSPELELARFKYNQRAKNKTGHWLHKSTLKSTKLLLNLPSAFAWGLKIRTRFSSNSQEVEIDAPSLPILHRMRWQLINPTGLPQHLAHVVMPYVIPNVSDGFLNGHICGKWRKIVRVIGVSWCCSLHQLDDSLLNDIPGNSSQNRNAWMANSSWFSSI